jgi:hypothetical protein
MMALTLIEIFRLAVSPHRLFLSITDNAHDAFGIRLFIVIFEAASQLGFRL